MQKKPLTKNSKLILADLFRAKRPLSISRIAERNRVTWKTADNSIKRLESKGFVNCKRSVRRTYCTVSREARKLIR